MTECCICEELFDNELLKKCEDCEDCFCEQCSSMNQCVLCDKFSCSECMQMVEDIDYVCDECMANDRRGEGEWRRAEN